MSTVKTDAELKGLRTRRDQLGVEVKLAQTGMDEARVKYESVRFKYDAVVREIKAMEAAANVDGSPIVISEHAYLRYLERGMGVDLVEVRRKMLTPLAEATISAMGTCKIKSNGLTLVVKNRTVVSVTE